MDKLEVIKLQFEFNNLKNDVEKFKWVKNNQSTGIVLMLDNDDTYGIISDNNDEDYLFEFDGYIGWNDGIFSLLEAYGIKTEGV